VSAARGRRRDVFVATVILWGLLGCSSRAFEFNAALDISQYAHTAWTIRMNAKPPIRILSVDGHPRLRDAAAGQADPTLVAEAANGREPVL